MTTTAQLITEWEHDFGDHTECPVCGTQCRDKFLEEPSADLLRVSEAMAEALRKALDQIPDYRDEDWPATAHEGFCHPDAGCDATCSEIAAMSETMQVRRLLIQWLAEWEKLRK